VSGALAAFGGAYLSSVFTSTYRQGQTGGQGYIGLATTIFGNWQPWGVFRGALLFGFPTALKFRAEKNVPALLVVFAVALVLLAVYMVWRKRSVIATGALAAAVCLMIAYNVIDQVPSEFVAATPYIVTVIVLAGARQQLRPPAHAGLPYRPGDSH
jgi:simple sugar transport system permease protein